jgi:hypothetical protein
LTGKCAPLVIVGCALTGILGDPSTVNNEDNK